MDRPIAEFTRVLVIYAASRWKHFFLAGVTLGVVCYPALALQTNQIAEGPSLDNFPLRKRFVNSPQPTEVLVPIPAELVAAAPPELDDVAPPPNPNFVNQNNEPTPAKRPFVGPSAPTPAIRQPTPTPTRSVPAPAPTGAENRTPPFSNSEPANTPVKLPATKISSTKSRNSVPASDVLPASFQEITPGVTTLADVREMFGRASQELTGKDSVTWVYKIGPFPKVVITGSQDVVTTVRLQLAQPTAIKEVEAELEISGYVPATVFGSNGKPRGQIYPERAVSLLFAENAKTPQVVEIGLERNSAEHFLLRVTSDRKFRYQAQFKDLQIAQELSPQDARPHWLRAKILLATGQLDAARESIEAALRLDPQAARYQLTKSWLLAESGQFGVATEETRALLTRRDLSQEVRAQAECQLGKLLASGTVRQFKEATEHLGVAIKLATPLAADHKFESRRAAKEVLLDANLAMAGCIAWGNWNSKSEVVPRWLKNGVAVAKDWVQNDGGDPASELKIYRATFGTSAAIGSDPSLGADHVLNLGRKLIAEATDPLRRRQLEWELGETLCQAMSASRAAAQYDEALALANNAIALIEAGARERTASPMLDQYIGSLYFTTGSIYAVGKKDHLEAVRWFDKALNRFGKQSPPEAHSDLGQFGERLVSMGVSFWQTGRRDHGMKLTKQGAQLIQRAVKMGTLPERALAIPYSNLASMHHELGHKDESQSYATLAAKLEPLPRESQRR